jgi:23S rRNA pseudouridine2605 synthase
VHLTHPRHHIAKTYQVWVRGHPSPAILKQWRQGIVLEEQVTQPTQVQILEQRDTQTLLELVLCEGRNRQIRKVAERLGHPVLGLHRVAIGPIQLESLPRGHWRHLNSVEIRILSTLAR